MPKPTGKVLRHQGGGRNGTGEGGERNRGLGGDLTSAEWICSTLRTARFLLGTGWINPGTGTVGWDIVAVHPCQSLTAGTKRTSSWYKLARWLTSSDGNDPWLAGTLPWAPARLAPGTSCPGCGQAGTAIIPGWHVPDREHQSYLTLVQAAQVLDKLGPQ